MKTLLQYCVLGALVCAIALVGLSLYILCATYTYTYSTVASAPDAEVALVLGASVRSSGELSVILKDRVDKAIELYRADKVKKILVTGDNATPEYNEVYPVGKYLILQGIPQKDIFLDYAGLDTYSSMYRARDVFTVKSMIIVTQQFHLPRALFLARALGLTAYGVDASHGQSHISNIVRELPAGVKALLDLATGRKPKYLGNTFPITGDGSATFVERAP